MFKTFAISKLAATAAVLILGLASADTANAIINGDFSRVGRLGRETRRYQELQERGRQLRAALAQR
jgi:hypothetical protein